MGLQELHNLITAGLLKKEAPDHKEFLGLVRSGRSRLQDASIQTLSNESRFILAYDAAHAFALAALRWHGFRPSGKRFIVFQALPHTLEIAAPVVRLFVKCHELRNLALYEGAFETDLQILSELVNSANELGCAIEKLAQNK
jgi:hypothetical protein